LRPSAKVPYLPFVYYYAFLADYFALPAGEMHVSQSWLMTGFLFAWTVGLQAGLNQVAYSYSLDFPAL